MATTERSPGCFGGRLNDPDGSAFLRGLCGEEVEFYLTIAGGRIQDARFHTDRCCATRACGERVAALAIGCTIEETMAISAAQVMAAQGLARDHYRCALLAVSALYKALVDYLLQP